MCTAIELTGIIVLGFTGAALLVLMIRMWKD